MNHLGVFAKYWQPGTVKTRLAKSIGPEKATGLYRIFVELTLQRFSNSGDTRSVWCWPPERKCEFERIASPAWQVHFQANGDLGRKMQAYFESSLKSHSRVVLIGSDTPNLPCRFIDQAFEALAKSDVVLGPSEDGGYYLIGMRTAASELFKNMTWSTVEVLAQTLNRAATAGHTCSLLEPWRDIDTIDDLIWLQQHCIENDRHETTSKSLLREIDAAMQGAALESDGEELTERNTQS